MSEAHAAIIRHLKNHKMWLTNGVECFFVPVNNLMGVKCYQHYDRAVINYCRQKWAFRYGLAPNLADFLSYRRDGMKVWGFVTERLRTFENENDPRLKREAYKDTYLKPNHHLIVGLKSAGFVPPPEYPEFDLHYQNVGLNAADELLPIDFGWGDPDTWDKDSELHYKVDKSDIFAILRKHNKTIQEFINEKHSFGPARLAHKYV